MQLEELKLKDVLCLVSALQQPQQSTDLFWKPGAKYFIRTVTHHHTGILVAITQQEIILKQAAWIPSDGRFTQALEKCEFEEVEVFPDRNVAIGRGSLIDAVEIATIPTSQK